MAKTETGLTISETKLFIGACDNANDVPLIEGKHGIGKSEAVKQYATENEYNTVELFLSMMDTGDLLGIPRTRTIGIETITTWAQPDWFNNIMDAAFPQTATLDSLVFTDPAFKSFAAERISDTVSRTDVNDLYCEFYKLPNNRLYITTKDSTVSHIEGKRSVLFLDELNRSNLDVRQACMQLILNKELHSHKLPYVRGENTLIVAAINPADDYQVDEMDPALLDRFASCYAKADAKAWLTWARANNVNQIVQDYIAEKPDRLHWTPKDQGIGSTPRSWTKLASFLDNIDKTPREIHFPVMKSKIGSELAGEFLSFFNNYSKVVKIDDVIKLVEKHAKRTQNPETIAKHVAKLLQNQEAIQKNQLVDSLADKFIKETDPAKAMPLIATLYSLETELLASFLKATREGNAAVYKKVVEFDSALNGKNLFRKITTKVQSADA